jgi:hypothetical protein
MIQLLTFRYDILEILITLSACEVISIGNDNFKDLK